MLACPLNAKPIFLILFVMLLAGCGNPQESNDPMPATTARQPDTETTNERDLTFVARAQEKNLEGILLGKLGQQRTSTEAVRELAKELEEMYRASRSELASLAIRKGIAVPGSAPKQSLEMVDQLNVKATGEFDQEYCLAVIRGHEEAINQYEVFIRGECDAEIKSWSEGMLPRLRHLLSKVKELNAEINPVSALLL